MGLMEISLPLPFHVDVSINKITSENGFSLYTEMQNIKEKKSWTEKKIQILILKKK